MNVLKALSAIVSNTFST